MQAEALKNTLVTALDDAKAQDIRALAVRELTSVTDYLIIASGTSDRHVKSLANSARAAGKEVNVRPLGVEGEQSGEWILLDFTDVIVHLMLPRVREFYQLEKLWGDADAS